MAKVHFTLPYKRRRTDDAFRAAMDEAMEIGTAALEEEAVRRAYHGVEEPVFYKGSRSQPEGDGCTGTGRRGVAPERIRLPQTAHGDRLFKQDLAWRNCTNYCTHFSASEGHDFSEEDRGASRAARNGVVCCPRARVTGQGGGCRRGDYMHPEGRACQARARRAAASCGPSAPLIWSDEIPGLRAPLALS
jgi:hypothetical protein